MCGFQISSFFLSEDVKDQIWRCEFMDFSVRRSTNPVRLTRRPSANNSSSFPGHPGTGCKGSVLMPECFTSVFRSSLHHFLAISISFGVPTKCTGGQCWFHYDTQFSKKKKMASRKEFRFDFQDGSLWLWLICPHRPSSVQPPAGVPSGAPDASRKASAGCSLRPTASGTLRVVLSTSAHFAGAFSRCFHKG